MTHTSPVKSIIYFPLQNNSLFYTSLCSRCVKQNHTSSNFTVHHGSHYRTINALELKENAEHKLHMKTSKVVFHKFGGIC